MNENANLSSKDREEVCDLAYSMRNYYPIVLICFLNSFISLLTLILLFFIWRSKELKRVYSLSGLDLKVSLGF